jgi:hypothetical protein
MPLVRIFLRPGTSPEYRKALGDGVHRALVEAFGIPADDRFQVISEHFATDLIYDPQYLGVKRSDRIVFCANYSKRWPEAAAKAKTLQAHGGHFGGDAGTILAGSAGEPGGDVVGKLVVW